MTGSVDDHLELTPNSAVRHIVDRVRMASVIRLVHCMKQYICQDSRFNVYRHGHAASTKSEDCHAHPAP